MNVVGYFCPFSKGAISVYKKFDSLRLDQKVCTIILSALTTLASLPFLGLAGFAAFRGMVERYAFHKITPPKSDEEKKGSSAKVNEQGMSIFKENGKEKSKQLEGEVISLTKGKLEKFSLFTEGNKPYSELKIKPSHKALLQDTDADCIESNYHLFLHEWEVNTPVLANTGMGLSDDPFILIQTFFAPIMSHPDADQLKDHILEIVGPAAERVVKKQGNTTDEAFHKILKHRLKLMSQEVDKQEVLDCFGCIDPNGLYFTMSISDGCKTITVPSCVLERSLENNKPIIMCLEGKKYELKFSMYHPMPKGELLEKIARKTILIKDYISKIKKGAPNFFSFYLNYLNPETTEVWLSPNFALAQQIKMARVTIPKIESGKISMEGMKEVEKVLGEGYQQISLEQLVSFFDGVIPTNEKKYLQVGKTLYSDEMKIYRIINTTISSEKPTNILYQYTDSDNPGEAFSIKSNTLYPEKVVCVCDKSQGIVFIFTFYQEDKNTLVTSNYFKFPKKFDKMYVSNNATVTMIDLNVDLTK